MHVTGAVRGLHRIGDPDAGSYAMRRATQVGVASHAATVLSRVRRILDCPPRLLHCHVLEVSSRRADVRVPARVPSSRSINMDNRCTTPLFMVWA